MVFLFILYFIYLILYGIISYAILFHLTRYRIPGDKSQVILLGYVGLSLLIIFGSVAFLRPF